MESKATALEKPRVVQLAAILLMVLPILDLVLSRGSGITFFNYISWSLIVLAGASFLIRHKLAWATGIVLCVSFLVVTVVDMVTGVVRESSSLSSGRLFDSLLVLFIVGLVSYFFRYPYLDRRQNWFGPTGERFAIETPVSLNGSAALTQDLSYTGAKLQLDEEGSVQIGEVVDLMFEGFDHLTCKARVLDVDSKQVRVEFEGLSAGQRERLRDWLTLQDAKKV